MSRSLLLALALAALLGSVAASGVAHVRGLHRGREERATQAVRQRIASFDEHARFLARQSPDDIARFLRDFRGVSRVRLADADGRVTAQFERVGYLVASLPKNRLPPKLADGAGELSGLETDRTRADLRPDLRNVFRHTVLRAGGLLELTVYAGPLIPEHVVTAAGEPMLDSGVRFTDSGWSVRLAPAPALSESAPYIALGIGVFTLGMFAFVLLARQRRAQERARIQSELAQGERLRSLGLLASGVAHEINNPLEGISNWLALGETERAREGLDRIAALTKDLLRFARGNDGPATTDDANVADAFRRARDLAQVSSVFKGVVVEDRLPADMTARVPAPAPALEQVFLNLLLNAGAATQAQPERRVRVSRNASGAIEIEDNGPGISEEDRERIFDPFFSRTGGSGLGLSVSYGLIEAAGGKFEAASSHGFGARFTLLLP